MNLSRKALTTAFALAMVSMLGIGAASGSAPESQPRAGRQARAGASASAMVDHTGADLVLGGAGQQVATVPAPTGGLDVLAGFPHQVHHDERLIEEEHELLRAAPHTLWSVDSGNA